MNSSLVRVRLQIGPVAWLYLRRDSAICRRVRIVFTIGGRRFYWGHVSLWCWQ